MNISVLNEFLSIMFLELDFISSKKKIEAETKHEINTRFVANQKLNHPNVRTSKIFKYFLIVLMHFGTKC